MPSQDFGLSRMESGLRRILQDCRTFGTPVAMLAKYPAHSLVITNSSVVHSSQQKNLLVACLH